MSPEIAICLLILAVAVVLFAWDRVPAEVIALGVMLALIASRVLPPERAFAGFSSDTMMMLLGLLIMSAGLIQTGVVDSAGTYVFRLAGRDPQLFLPVILVSVAAVSAFMSNTAATAFFVPLVMGYAGKVGISPSKLLLPVAFASILSSSVTLVSTSTNLVVSGMLTRYGLPPMGMFELALVGIPITIAGILYMWAIGTRLIPERENQKAEETIGERHYQADVVIVEASPLIGRTLKQAKFTKDAGLTVVKLIRGNQALQTRLKSVKLQPGDELIIEGSRADLLKIKDLKGLDFKADVHLADPNAAESEVTIVEGVLLPRSPLIGRSLKSLEFKERYGLQVLALHRPGRVPHNISSARLRFGDVLLLQGKPENVKELERGNLFNIFGGVDPARLYRSRAPLAAAIFAAVIAAITLKLASIPVAVLGGAFLMFLTRCLSPEEAYRQVEWRVLILIGALLSLGEAMDQTGAGRYLALQLIELAGADNPYLLLSCFFVLTVALTQPMSNQAAALVVLPIAIQTGLALGTNPRAFAMMVAVAASCSYLTPLEPSCLMVYGPGKYRFSDFFRVGMPLTVIIYLLAILLVPQLWPI
jgi:di/tricarboxylate transporter